MKKETLSILVSYINIVVNQIDAYKIYNKIHIDEGLMWFPIINNILVIFNLSVNI